MHARSSRPLVPAIGVLLLSGLLLCTSCYQDKKGAAPTTPARAQAAETAITVDFAGGGRQTSEKANQLPRKIVYTADVRLITQDLDKTQTELKLLLKDNDGQLAAENITGTVGSVRTGVWTVRVKVERFDAFLDAVKKLGVLESTITKSQDVTEEFYDLDARIKQKKVEEKGLLELQKEAAAILNKDPKARMDDVLAVRREWNNVRQEIERMEGRLKLLTHQSDLTTVTITIQERKDYVPPNPPTFGADISDTFGSSWNSLVDFGKALVLIGVGLAPWLPIILLVVVLPGVLLLRRRRTRRASPLEVTPA